MLCRLKAVCITQHIHRHITGGLRLERLLSAWALLNVVAASTRHQWHTVMVRQGDGDGGILWCCLRAVVTAADGRVRWVDMPTAGQETFLTDFAGGGTKGAIWRNKRFAPDKVAFHQYGYNQVCD